MSNTIDLSAIKSNFRRAKVLIIEDDDDHWYIMQQAMQQCLSEVKLVRVASAQAALSLFEEWIDQEWELPQLIFLDLYLPDCQAGWEVLKQLKELPSSLRVIPVVMFSSSTRQEDITKAYQLGVSSYVAKPIDLSEWLTYFQELRTYWWETVTLPPVDLIS